MRKKNSQTGKIVPNGVSLEKHEYDTILYLTNLGYDVELVPPSNIPKTKSPDICMRGKFWEIKSPEGKNIRTIEHAFKRAVKQSENIILDLRRNKVNAEIAVKCIQKLLGSSRRVREIWVITNENGLLTLRNK